MSDEVDLMDSQSDDDSYGDLEEEGEEELSDIDEGEDSEEGEDESEEKEQAPKVDKKVNKLKDDYMFEKEDGDDVEEVKATKTK